MGVERAHFEGHSQARPSEVDFYVLVVADWHQVVPNPSLDPSAPQPSSNTLLLTASVPYPAGTLSQQPEKQLASVNCARRSCSYASQQVLDGREAVREGMIETAFDRGLIDEARQEQHRVGGCGDPCRLPRHAARAVDCRTAVIPAWRTRRSSQTMTTTLAVLHALAGTGMLCTSAADVAAIIDPGTASEAASIRCSNVTANDASLITSRNTGTRAPFARRRARACLSTPQVTACSTVMRTSCLAATRPMRASRSKVEWAWRIANLPGIW